MKRHESEKVSQGRVRFLAGSRHREQPGWIDPEWPRAILGCLGAI